MFKIIAAISVGVATVSTVDAVNKYNNKKFARTEYELDAYNNSIKGSVRTAVIAAFVAAVATAAAEV